MKVSELIDRLSKIPGDPPVFVIDTDRSYDDWAVTPVLTYADWVVDDHEGKPYPVVYIEPYRFE